MKYKVSIKIKKTDNEILYEVIMDNIKIGNFTLTKMDYKTIKKYLEENKIDIKITDNIYLITNLYRTIDDEKYIKLLNTYQIPDVTKNNEKPLDDKLKKKIKEKIKKFMNETKISKNLTLNDIKGIMIISLKKILNRIKNLTFIFHPIKGYKKKAITFENFYKTNEEREKDLMDYYKKNLNVQCFKINKYITQKTNKKINGYLCIKYRKSNN